MSDLTHISASLQGNRSFRWIWYKCYYTWEMYFERHFFGTQVVEGQTYEITWKAVFKSWPAQRSWKYLTHSRGAQILIILKSLDPNMSSVCKEACKGHISDLQLAQPSRYQPDRNLAFSSPSASWKYKIQICSHLQKHRLSWLVNIKAFYYSLQSRTLWSYNLRPSSRCSCAGCTDPSLHQHCSWLPPCLR